MTNSFTNRNFGVEIECYGFRGEQRRVISIFEENKIPISYYNNPKKNWSVKSDCSLEYGGLEIVSQILSGETGIEQIKKVCEIIQKNDGKVDRSCGLHVHVGIEDLSGIELLRVIKSYSFFESIIDGWMDENRRGNKNEYCLPTSYNLEHVNFSGENGVLGKKDPSPDNIGRITWFRSKLNPHAITVHGTLEFRHHHGTIDFIEISNWIRFCVSFIEIYKKEDSENIPLFEGMDPELKEYYKNRFTELSPEIPLPSIFAETLFPRWTIFNPSLD